ncbi:poliovirus receptor-like isoform X5 [Brienomyrus brachyistius]|uniref:poliovirus receptor-like isoform X5 n=1 Tax=Brienomyrus brachyistius TaxID=42636 RepID=UPI0020B29EF4|nr:poliovirus receptor-like isoform X5 [Brienomyrus brachyistius]
MYFMFTFVNFMFSLPWISHGLTELVRTQQDVMASLGEDVNLTCELTQQKNVKQVTWQRVSEQTSEIMATYSERFGATVSWLFRKNVNFLKIGLQHCSIVIRRVQWSDESCYKCLFNVFPDGAISGRTCLKIYELHKPIFVVKPVSGESKLLLTCSATGKPAPELSWDIEDTAPEHSTTYCTDNQNGTITVTKTATVQITPTLLANTTQIKCAAQQEFGEQKENFITIPNDEMLSNKARADIWPVVPLVLVILCVMGFGFYRYLHRKIHNRKQNASCGSTLQAQNAPDSCQDQVGLLDGALVRRSQSRSFSMQITLPDGSSVKKRQGRFKDGSKVKRRHTLLPSPTQNTTSDIPDNESSQDFPVQERPKRRHTIGPSLTQNTNFEGEKVSPTSLLQE